MKKSLSLLLALALVFGLFSSMASAADAAPATPAEKFQWFLDQGILKGTGDGEMHLDRDLMRSEFAEIIASVGGLSKTGFTGSTYVDVLSTQWFYGAVEAASAAGLMNGTGNDKFSPSAKVTVEQVAVVAARMLGLAEVEGAVVAGASKWAGPYLQAAIDAKLVAANADFTADATRGQTFVVAFEVVQQSQAPKGTEVVSAAATGVKKVTVKFNQEVDTSKAVISLKRDVFNVTVAKTTWNDAKTEATVETSVNLSAGDYIATVSGIELVEGKATASFTVTAEKVTSIALEDAAYLVAGSSTSATIGYKILNQYEQEFSGSTNPIVTIGNAGVTAGTITSKSAILSGIIPGTPSLQVTIVETNSAVSVSKEVAIRNTKAISDITLSAPEVKTGDTAILTAKTYEIKYVAKDQYGNEVKLPANTNLLTTTTTITTNKSAEISAVATDPDGKLNVTLGAFDGPKTLYLQLIVNATGKNDRVEFVAHGNSVVSEVQLLAPTARIGANESGAKLELQAKDQFGNAMSAANIVSAYTSNAFTIVSGNTSVITLPVTPAPSVVQDGDKAYVVINATANKGNSVITVTVNANGKSSSQTVTVVDAKYAAAVTLSANYTKAVFAGANSGSITLKGKFVDQYGEEFKSAAAVTATVVELSGGAGKFGADTQVSVYDFINTGVVYTPNAADLSATIKVELKNGANVVDTKTIGIASVKADAALTVVVEDLGTIYSGAANAGSAYAKEVKVSAVDATGAKVALATNAIQNITSSNPAKIGVNLASKKVFAGTDFTTPTAAADFEGIVNVTVANGGNAEVIQAPVKISTAAPTPVSVVFQKDGKDLGASIKVPTTTVINFNDEPSDTYAVVVKDQYGTKALSSNVTFYVTDTAGSLTVNNTGIVTFTGTSTQKYKVTAVIGDKTANLTVEIQ